MLFIMRAIYFILFLLFVVINKLNSLYLLAVSNETGIKIKFNVYLVENKDDKTDVFFSSQSFVSPDTQFSMNLAKDVVCSLFTKKCEKYDFLIKINSESPLLAGPSGGAAFATGMIMALFGLPDKEVGITGTINPGGIIGPVGGVDKKVESSLDLEKIIIPLGQKNYRDPISNKTKNLNYSNVYEVGTIFDILKIVWNLEINFNLSKLEVPDWYNKKMKEIAQSLCSKVNKTIDNSSDYYSQASYCFRELNKLLDKKYQQYDKSALLNKAEELKNKLKEIEERIKNEIKEVDSFNELQLYMILYKRIDDAKDTLNKVKNTTKKKELASLVAYSEARIISVEEWSKFLKNLPKSKKINYDELKILCNKNYEFVKHYFNQIFGVISEQPQLATTLYGFFEQINNDMIKLEEYKYKDSILCIAYAKEIKSSLDYLSAVLYLGPNLVGAFFNSTNKITEFYLRLNKEFPIMAYSYWKYASEIAKKEKNYYLAINYNYLAMNLATMIYEISSNNQKKIYLKTKEKSKKQYLTANVVVYLFVISIVVYYLIVLKNTLRV